MLWTALVHVVLCGVALAAGLVLGSGPRRGVRQRNALRWAYETARAEADRARKAETEARAELERARGREAAARAELDAALRRADPRAPTRGGAAPGDAQAGAPDDEELVITLADEVDEAARDEAGPPAPEAAHDEANAAAALHAALVAAVRRVDEERAQLHLSREAAERAAAVARQRIDELTRQVADARALIEATRLSEAESRRRLARERDDLLAVVAERDRCVERLQRDLRRKGERIEDLTGEMVLLRAKGFGRVLRLLGVRRPAAARSVDLAPRRAAAG